AADLPRPLGAHLLSDAGRRAPADVRLVGQSPRARALRLPTVPHEPAPRAVWLRRHARPHRHPPPRQGVTSSFPNRARSEVRRFLEVAPLPRDARADGDEGRAGDDRLEAGFDSPAEGRALLHLDADGDVDDRVDVRADRASAGDDAADAE